MSKTKTSTNQQYSNQASYGQIQPQSNQYIDAYANYKPEVDPTIPYAAAASRNRLNASYLNPMGGYTTPQIREKSLLAGNRGIDEQAAMATRAGQYDVNQQRMGQLGSLAALMAPRIVQTGASGTGSSTTEQGKNVWGNVLDVAQAGAGMAMM
jgi:hypothetical protein